MLFEVLKGVFGLKQENFAYISMPFLISHEFELGFAFCYNVVFNYFLIKKGYNIYS